MVSCPRGHRDIAPHTPQDTHWQVSAMLRLGTRQVGILALLPPACTSLRSLSNLSVPSHHLRAGARNRPFSIIDLRGWGERNRMCTAHALFVSFLHALKVLSSIIPSRAICEAHDQGGCLLWLNIHRGLAMTWNKGFQTAPCLSGTIYKAAVRSILRTNAEAEEALHFLCAWRLHHLSGRSQK